MPVRTLRHMEYRTRRYVHAVMRGVGAAIGRLNVAERAGARPLRVFVVWCVA